MHPNYVGTLAQMVEQRTENPCVPGSIPGGTTKKPLKFKGFFYVYMQKVQHILIIGSVWPEPNSSAAGSRMMQLIELFRSQNWNITFASAAADSEFMVDLHKNGIEKKTITLNNQSFNDFIKELQPGIVLFDRFMTEEQYGWRVAECCPDALRILDTEDLHCLRSARQHAFKEKKNFSIHDLISDVAKREIASIYRCDISLIISEYEMDLLQKYFKVPSALLHYVPFLLEPINDVTINSWPTFEERQHFITIGNFLHEPNWNSVLFLKEEIWPLIKKALPQAEMHIYGAYPSQKVDQLHNSKDGFLIKGRAPEVTTVMRNARVCLAPLRFGAGLKGKLIDAMMNGTPSVTTTIGAEAMHGNLNWGGNIADTAQEIADSAIALYSHKEQWMMAQKNGVKISNQIFPKKFHEKSLLDKISVIYQTILKHREQNFTGAMLMHHQLASTKFMSKWIELKNQADKASS